MADIDIIDEMIKQDALEQPQDSRAGKLLVKLCEPQSPNSEATIHNLPPDARVIKVDKFAAPKNIFNGNKGECKRADYVIISAEKKCILYLEMKLTKGKPEEVIQQLKGAQCFIQYCKEIGRVFWDDSNFLEKYTHRFIIIANTNIREKGKTRINKKETLHDSPEKAMQIDYPNHLEFNELAGLRAK